MASPEGIIKFQQVWECLPLPDLPSLWELCWWRNLLVRYGLVGASDGVGYGNVSRRCGEGAHFFITGSGTGGLPELRPEHCVEVWAVELEQNLVYSRGLLRPSSESLTHAALYVCSPTIGAVVHAHHGALWHRLWGVVPTTDPAIPYGTPELAYALQELYQQHRLGCSGLIVMGGHKEGLLSFGNTLADAVGVLLYWLTQG